MNEHACRYLFFFVSVNKNIFSNEIIAVYKFEER